MLRATLPFLLLSLPLAATAHPNDHAAHGATAHGATATPASPDRILDIRMDDDMRFHPEKIEAKAGETLLLRVRNAGVLPHEIVLGRLADLLAHAQEMRENPDMPMHNEPNALTLEPGKAGELLWTFDGAGTVDFACLIPGHFEAGMKGQIVVAAADHVHPGKQ